MTLPPCQVIALGHVPYREAWELQRRLATARGADTLPDTLLWLEHPHTYTLGSAGDAANVLFSPEEMAARGIELLRVDRGGDVTYHGPGQMVGYPILKLAPGGDGLHADVIAYVRQLEQALIEALETYGIAGRPYPGLTGVWVERSQGLAKIAAIGVRVTTRRVTMHGFALNINTDMDYFKGIIPCGISDKPVTSMAQLCGATFNLEEVAGRVIRSFRAVFGRAVYSADRALLEGIPRPEP